MPPSSRVRKAVEYYSTDAKAHGFQHYTPSSTEVDCACLVADAIWDAIRTGKKQDWQALQRAAAGLLDIGGKHANRKFIRVLDLLESYVERWPYKHFLVHHEGFNPPKGYEGLDFKAIDETTLHFLRQELAQVDPKFALLSNETLSRELSKYDRTGASVGRGHKKIVGIAFALAMACGALHAQKGQEKRLRSALAEANRLRGKNDN